MEEKEIKFKPGDKVKLKTGGPNMIINEYQYLEGEPTGYVWCIYFDLLENEYRKVYPENGLEKIE